MEKLPRAELVSPHLRHFRYMSSLILHPLCHSPKHPQLMEGRGDLKCVEVLMSGDGGATAQGGGGVELGSATKLGGMQRMITDVGKRGG